MSTNGRDRFARLGEFSITNPAVRRAVQEDRLAAFLEVLDHRKRIAATCPHACPGAETGLFNFRYITVDGVERRQWFYERSFVAAIRSLQKTLGLPLMEHFKPPTR